MSNINRCRTCLDDKKEMRHNQTVIKIAGEDIRLSDILDNFYDYKISADDQLPQNICIACVYHLTVTYSFKVLIKESVKTLEKGIDLEELKSDNYNSNIDPDDDDFTDDYLTDYFKFGDFKPEKSDDLKTKKLYSKRYSTNLVSRHPKMLNEVYCVECKEKFTSVQSLSQHCVNAHPVPSTLATGIAECDYCNQKFEDFKSLQKHIKLHITPYVCENCWDGFNSISEMGSHICPVEHLKKKERVLMPCDQCGKSYPPGYIKIHIRTHGNDLRYACKYCPKRFKVPCSLSSHVLWNHKKTRNHKCHICNGMFVSASQRSTHIRTQHLHEKNHACETCGKKFFSKSDVRRHAVKHTGDKKFHCDLCNKSFQRKYGLTVHLKSHVQINSYPEIKKRLESNIDTKFKFSE